MIAASEMDRVNSLNACETVAYLRDTLFGVHRPLFKRYPVLGSAFREQVMFLLINPAYLLSNITRPDHLFDLCQLEFEELRSELYKPSVDKAKVEEEVADVLITWSMVIGLGDKALDSQQEQTLTTHMQMVGDVVGEYHVDIQKAVLEAIWGKNSQNYLREMTAVSEEESIEDVITRFAAVYTFLRGVRNGIPGRCLPPLGLEYPNGHTPIKIGDDGVVFDAAAEAKAAIAHTDVGLYPLLWQDWMDTLQRERQ